MASRYSIGVLEGARLVEGKEVGALVKSPVIKSACSDLQHAKIGDHRVKDEVAR